MSTTMDVPVGAVVSDHEESSKVGRDILLQNGSAVDAAIATAICNGVINPQSSGIGGGTFLVVYDKRNKETISFDGRCVAPKSMTSELFEKHIDQNVAARAIGVPGALVAFKRAHERFGRLPWAALFEPTIQLLRRGFPMSPSTQFSFYLDSNYGLKKYVPIDRERFPLLTSIFCSRGHEKKAGDLLHWPRLVDTLEGIAREGPGYIYDTHVTQTLVEELQQEGGVHRMEDFQQYEARIEPACSVNIGEFDLHAMPGASGGPLVAFLLNVLKGCEISPSDVESPSRRAELYHTIVEAIKFALPLKEQLGDTQFVDMNKVLEKTTSDSYARTVRDKITAETHDDGYYSDVTLGDDDDVGTSHISVLGPDGDAVSLTSTIFMYFGSRIVSPSTGIVWNNVLDNFAMGRGEVPNVCAPGKRPRSSMAPVILTDKSGNARVVTGAAGGSRIITSVVQVLCKMLWAKMPLVKAVEEKRFHFTVGTLYLENGFPQDIKEMLAKRGHYIVDDLAPHMAVVGIIFVDNGGGIQALADMRKRPGKACYVFRTEMGENRSGLKKKILVDGKPEHKSDTNKWCVEGFEVDQNTV